MRGLIIPDQVQMVPIIPKNSNFRGISIYFIILLKTKRFNLPFPSFSNILAVQWLILCYSSVSYNSYDTVTSLSSLNSNSLVYDTIHSTQV